MSNKHGPLNCMASKPETHKVMSRMKELNLTLSYRTNSRTTSRIIAITKLLAPTLT